MVTFKLLCTEYLSFPVTILIYINKQYINSNKNLLYLNPIILLEMLGENVFEGTDMHPEF